VIFVLIPLLEGEEAGKSSRHDKNPSGRRAVAVWRRANGEIAPHGGRVKTRLLLFLSLSARGLPC